MVNFPHPEGGNEVPKGRSGEPRRTPSAARRVVASRDAAARAAWTYELLGRLLSGTLHDLRNLLALRITELALIQSELPAGSAGEEALRNLIAATDLESTLIERLMMVVSGRSPPDAIVDVNDACAEAASLLKNSMISRVSLEMRLRPGLPPVHAGAAELRRILLNLCLNACDAMPRGGRLLIETDRGTGAPSGPAGDFISLQIRDSGEGMSPEVQARIFEPFFSTKPAGRNTGQGLAIVTDLVRQLGGMLECSSVPGEGTHFVIWLPIAPASALRREA